MVIVYFFQTSEPRALAIGVPLGIPVLYFAIKIA